MVSSSEREVSQWNDGLVANLTEAAYQVALRHGIRAPFVDVQLDIWSALRAVMAEHLEESHSCLCPL